MRIKQLLPALLILLFSLGTILIYNIVSKRLTSTTEHAAEKVVEPVYTYLSPYVELSPYDKHFREAADSTGYDWTLIAAIAYTESRFDSTAVSHAGAQGVMQVMPNTLRGFGIPDSMHADNYTNIMAAAKLLKSIEEKPYFKRIEPIEERMKFVLASYNAGYGHILDAMSLARKHGCNRHIWENSVDSFLKLKSDPEYHTDTLCRNGEFNGWRETLSFVRKVHRNWRKFSTAQQSYTDSIMLIIANDSTKRIMQ
ncbi:MAG: transglycosylase SLT domain-containing protein [Bacteroidaceae bacterium]|nr:transglycosylase SLT domain-containing protein [Bacteroidaceae bacterium]